MPRARIRLERAEYVTCAHLRQVVPKQDDLRLGDPGDAQGRHAIGRLLNPKAGLGQHHGQIVARPPVVVGDQNRDARVSTHQATSIRACVDGEPR